MNKREVIQNEKIEKLFTKFDADGSGALDQDELHQLFKDNEVNINKDTIKAMFNN